uniref:Reverse transcriptase domain-containing protein n=1 Tax=Tanacetum cinerariifolium TaxID=118510 RepID=A0A6L2NZG4_TANCI|nr:reverse transcriptase domain-containing protein [Tanacetum cinerariifolium]
MVAMTMKMDAQYKEMGTECNHYRETFMDLKTKLETTTKSHQALIQNLEAKFDRLADKQSARPSGSLPSNTQPNPRGMPNYGKNFKELVSNKHKLDKISYAFISIESLAIIQNKDPPKLEDPESFLIPRAFSKTFSCNALANLDASINLMPYSPSAKLSLKTLKPTKMSMILTDRSFQYPIGIAKNMLVNVGKFTFLVDFVILEMEEDSIVLPILGRPFLHTAYAVICVKQKQLNLGVGSERMVFSIDSAMKHSYSNDDTSCSSDVIDEIIEEDFDTLLNEGSKILYSIEGTPYQEKTTFTCPFGTKSYRIMPFGLCNAPATFQRCMLEIFHDMIEESIEVFMDDFYVFEKSFNNRLHNLDKMLKRRKDASLFFNWEKCHFMVKEGIVLGQKVSEAGLEADKAKIDVISKLPPPTNVKGMRIFWDMPNFVDVS